MSDTHYRAYKLSLEEKKNLLIDAQKKCRNWWVDILDCTKSMTRQKIEMPFEEILSKLKENSHFVVIQREIANYLEIGFSTMNQGPDYFLWIVMEPDYINDGCIVGLKLEKYEDE